MGQAGHAVRCLACDEELRLSDVDGTQRTLQDNVDILYVTSHGRFMPGGYQALFHGADWMPLNTGIGKARLVVAVFDTCFLIDGSRNWQALWSSANLGPSLRLLLGFDGLAAMDRPAALRGMAFAENILNGKTFADAWIQAVHSTTTSQYSKAVAIGIGDSLADAQSVLNTAGSGFLPPPRKGIQPFFMEKF
jgi:hypothetical protein